MKRLIVSIACGALVACATPASTVTEDSAASTPAAVLADAGGPRSCPQKTETLYKAQLPEPGFVPAPPRGATAVKPQRLHAAEPSYPSASQRCHEEGKVAISYCVSADGKVENVQVVNSSGFARLDNAILAWANRETHTPGTINGRAVRYCGLSLVEEFNYKNEAGGEARVTPRAG